MILRILLITSVQKLSLFYYIYIQVRNDIIFHSLVILKYWFSSGNGTVSKAWDCGAKGHRFEPKTIHPIFAQIVGTCTRCNGSGKRVWYNICLRKCYQSTKQKRRNICHTLSTTRKWISNCHTVSQPTTDMPIMSPVYIILLPNISVCTVNNVKTNNNLPQSHSKNHMSIIYFQVTSFCCPVVKKFAK